MPQSSEPSPSQADAVSAAEKQAMPKQAMPSWSAFQDLLKQAVGWRHHLHQHPELSLSEHQTTRFIRDLLDQWGIPWSSCTETGTVAYINPDQSSSAGSGQTAIGLRADIDALPITEQTACGHQSLQHGVMHACGHDGHTAALLAACYMLWQQRSQLRNEVRAIFQPGEEGAFGMREMVRAGVADGLDACYAIHSWPAMPRGTLACPDGPVMSANAEWRLCLSGRGGHASQPEQCDDVVQLLCQWVNQVHQLIARRLPPQQAAVCSVTQLQADSGINVLPSEATAAGTVRAADTTACAQIGQWLDDLAQALPWSGSAVLDWQPKYPATHNDPQCAAQVRSLWQQQALWQQDLPLMASEDFSYLAEQVPAAYVLLGAGDDDHSVPCHSPMFDFNDALLTDWVSLLVQLAGGVFPAEVSALPHNPLTPNQHA